MWDCPHVPYMATTQKQGALWGPLLKKIIHNKTGTKITPCQVKYDLHWFINNIKDSGADKNTK